MSDAKRSASICVPAVLFMLAAMFAVQPTGGFAQASNSAPKVTSDEEQAKQVALSALKLLHDNQISKLYREKISELQKQTGLTSEAKAIGAFSPAAQRLPGAPQERTLLFAKHSETLPVLFHDLKGDFYSLVFLAKYPAGSVQEEVYMVKEKSEWKVAAIGIRDTL
jgi:hypothetical protein